MINVEQSEMHVALAQLEQAIDNHGQWFDAITRTLICRLPHDQRDVLKDAHRHCLLGQWYYGAAHARLRELPGFVAIESEHKDMHKQAASLLQTAASGAPISALEFDRFANALKRLRLEIFTLKRELEDALYNLDALTGAHNRIGMLTKLREQHELVKRGVQSCCIAMLDLDHFKAVNDTQGHAAGDKALTLTARYVMDHVRPYDKLFRYGGEEFLLCMQSTDAAAGHEVVERMRQGLAANPIDLGGKNTLQMTMSIGVTLLAADISVEEAIERADKAMYAAKRAGRNCTRVWDSSM
jgi:diguanylate cyclase